MNIIGNFISGQVMGETAMGAVLMSPSTIVVALNAQLLRRGLK
jgi:hypothetical protein